MLYQAFLYNSVKGIINNFNILLYKKIINLIYRFLKLYLNSFIAIAFIFKQKIILKQIKFDFYILWINKKYIKLDPFSKNADEEFFFNFKEAKSEMLFLFGNSLQLLNYIVNKNYSNLYTPNDFFSILKTILLCMNFITPKWLVTMLGYQLADDRNLWVILYIF